MLSVVMTLGKNGLPFSKERETTQWEEAFMLNANIRLMSSHSYMDGRQKSSILISAFAQEDYAYQNPSAQ